MKPKGLVLYDVRYLPSIKKSLFSIGKMDVPGYNTTFDSGSWTLTKGSRLVKGTSKDILYCMQGKALLSKFSVAAALNNLFLYKNINLIFVIIVNVRNKREISITHMCLTSKKNWILCILIFAACLVNLCGGFVYYFFC